MDIDIDIPSHKRERVFDTVRKYLESIGGNITRVATFGTKTGKSAITTACRGVGVDSDTAKHLSSLIPIERGKVRDLHTCYYGKGDIKPIAEFVNICNQYAHLNLIEVAFGIEGMVDSRSVHSCGVVITNTDITDHNAVMVAGNGEFITAWSLSECEYTGGIKYDFLNLKSGTMIQLAFENLIKAGHMEWQGSLRATYEKYLMPHLLDKDNQEMWYKLNHQQILSAFQFESQAGAKALSKIKPTSVIEMAAANTLMRLQSDGEEQPIDVYTRYKNDINEWYKDMETFGLNDDEVKILERHLLHDYGVSATQESMMMLSMDNEIAGFDVVESNMLRKAVAKYYWRVM